MVQSQRGFSDFHPLCVSFFLYDNCLDVSLSLSKGCCCAACVEAQWHDQRNSVQFLMNADKATDETDGIWLYSAVMSLLNKLIILVMMFHYNFFYCWQTNKSISVFFCVLFIYIYT